jgi:hypothetical protein
MVHLQPKARAGTQSRCHECRARRSSGEGAQALREGWNKRVPRIQQSCESLKEAVSLYPNFPLALNELGVQYLKLRQVNKAIDFSKRRANSILTPLRRDLNLGIALLEANSLKKRKSSCVNR